MFLASKSSKTQDFQMNCDGCRTKRDRLSQSHVDDDGEGDSDASFEMEQKKLLSSSLPTLRHSEPRSALSPVASSPPLCRIEDSLPISRPVKQRKDRWEQKRIRNCSKIFLLVVAVIIPPTLIAIANIKANYMSHNQLLLVRDNFDDISSSSISHAKNWFGSRRRRYLEDETDMILENDDDGLNATIDDFDESDESDVVNNGLNQTAPPTEPPVADDELATIEITLPAGVSNQDEDIADVIDSLIPPSNTTDSAVTVDSIAEESASTAEGETTEPISPESPTNIPSTLEPGSSAPSPPPSVSFAPSSAPTMSPRPTITYSPTSSHAPSFLPSDVPSNFPTLEPSETFAPSSTPSATPTVSQEPSSFPSPGPTAAPTLSPFPSAHPTISPEPTISFSPSSAPTDTPTSMPSSRPTPVATEKVNKNKNKMILTNVPYPLKNNTASIEIWENVTSLHIKNYYLKFSEIFTHEQFFEVREVETTFIEENILEGEVAEGDDVTITGRKDTPIDAPPVIPADIPGTLKIEIIYDQWVTYETDELNITDENLRNRLFVIPFTTDSLHYSIDLYESLNWTTWVHVETVLPTQPEPQPPAPPSIASRLTAGQTFAIAASTIIAACLIVFALLWERTQKGRGDDSSSIDSAMHAMQGTSVGEPGSPWSNVYYNGTEEINVDATYSSIRSAPGHLRRDSIERGFIRPKEAFEGRRGRASSKDNGPNPSIGKFGSHRSTSSQGSNSGHIREIREQSPKHSPKEESYGSPGVPQQVPVSIRGTGEPSATNRSNRNEKSEKGDRPFLPPLPPPSSFGTPERARTVDSLMEVGTVVHSKDYNSNVDREAYISRPTSTAFRRPSSRAFAMRLSGVGNDDMTEISILTDPFPSDRRRYSGADLVIPNPQFADPNSDSMRSRSEAFLSPLHIPDEENINRSPIDPLLSPTPESPIPNILGLESRPINDAITPARTGFVMTVKDIEDDLEK